MLLLIALTRSCPARLSCDNGGCTITETVELKEVTAVFERTTDHINYLTIIDEFGNEQVIATTDAHPFWVVTDEPDLDRAAREVVDENGVILYHENLEPGLNGFWVEAKDLREGDVVLGANGELSTVVSNERVEFPDGITVYNFTVDGNHNYFVIAETDESGQTCILVHNAEGAGKLFEKIKSFKFKVGSIEISAMPKPIFSMPTFPWKDYGNRLINEPFFKELAKIAQELFAKLEDIRMIGVKIENTVKLGSALLKLTPGIEFPTVGKPKITFDIDWKF